MDASSRQSLCVAAAIRLSWRQHSLHPSSTLSTKVFILFVLNKFEDFALIDCKLKNIVLQCALAVVHYGLCFPSSRLMHAMAPAPSSFSTSPAFPRRAAARVPLLRPRPRARHPRRRLLRPSPHRRPPRTPPPPRLRLVHVARSATTILPPNDCGKQQRHPWLLRRGRWRQTAACIHRWRLRMDKSQNKIRIKDCGLNSN
ncbi:hypothetical protein ACQJBY_000426 [Aegilops geniculata]